MKNFNKNAAPAPAAGAAAAAAAGAGAAPPLAAGGGCAAHVATLAETRKQDEDMDAISGVLDALNHAGLMMGEELDKQVRRRHNQSKFFLNKKMHSCKIIRLSRDIVLLVYHHHDEHHHPILFPTAISQGAINAY